MRSQSSKELSQVLPKLSSPPNKTILGMELYHPVLGGHLRSKVRPATMCLDTPILCQLPLASCRTNPTFGTVVTRKRQRGRPVKRITFWYFVTCSVLSNRSSENSFSLGSKKLDSIYRLCQNSIDLRAGNVRRELSMPGRNNLFVVRYVLSEITIAENLSLRCFQWSKYLTRGTGWDIKFCLCFSLVGLASLIIVS